MKNYGFGCLQLRIMHVLWDKKRANAREITDALNVQEPIAHSTVQTILRTLEKKGAIDHDIDDRTFIFYPLVKNEKVVKDELGNFLERLFAGSPGSMVSYLVKNQYISSDELKKISELFEEEDK
ncbi:BlaI/MecI/CopY family transcriptional regulator [Candidatus Latescibacterota bacterium]